MSYAVWDRKERIKRQDGKQACWLSLWATLEDAQKAMNKLIERHEEARRKGRTNRVLELEIHEWPNPWGNSSDDEEEGLVVPDEAAH